MKDDEKYLDPDRTPLESEEDAPIGADADKFPLEDEGDPIYDPNQYPMDGSTSIVSLFREVFGTIPDVQLESTKFKKTESGLLIDGKDVSELSADEIASAQRLIEDFRRKQRE